MKKNEVLLSCALQAEYETIMQHVERFLNRRLGQLRRGHRERAARQAKQDFLYPAGAPNSGTGHGLTTRDS